MIKLAVAGASGRMGKTILALAIQDPAFQISGATEAAGHAAIGHDVGVLTGNKPAGVVITGDAEEALKQADVLIDFTHFSAARLHLQAALKTRKGLVIGTTALDEPMVAELRKAAKEIPIVYSPNMSVGVNLLFKLTEIAARALDESYDAEISEVHHRMKKDAPSGTALKLLEILAQARKRDAGQDAVYGRKGDTGARERGKIGVSALRGGDVIGDHTVFFLGDGERIELSHRLSSRSALAQGALVAAKFVANQKNGFYNMQQVLGII